MTSATEENGISQAVYTVQSKSLFIIPFSFTSKILLPSLLILACRCEVNDRSAPPSHDGGYPPVKAKARTVSYKNEYLSIVKDLKRIFGDRNIPDGEPFIARVESLSQEMGQAAVHPPASMVDAMIKKVYGEWGVAFDTDRNNLQALLPHTILQRKKGSCLGVSLIFLLMAEAQDYPVFGVLLPGHFFIRYDDGEIRRNIEPNLGGYQHPDAYYFNKYIRRQDSWYDLVNLTKAESMAVFYYNLGNVCRVRGKYTDAVRFYRKCLETISGFAETWGNLAITYAAMNRVDDARKAFLQAETLNPGLALLSRNFGAFELRNARYREAVAIYRRGLFFFPNDEELFYGLALASFHLKHKDSALYYLNRIEKSSPVFPRAAALYKRLSAGGK